MMNEKQTRQTIFNWILLWLFLALGLYLSGVRPVGAQATSASSAQVATAKPVPSWPRYSAQAATAEPIPALTNPAGEPPYHTLRVYLRYDDGTAVTAEPITLERLPQALPMPCVTDANGRCTWQVGRGLYQVLLDRPLDQISALSLAEGGLRGFGLTVGEFDIAYHFVFHHDGRAYFDAAPDALRPKPILPQFHSLQGGILPDLPDAWAASYTETVTTTQRNDTAVTATGSTQTETPVPTASSTILLLVVLGLLLGGGLHLLQRRWATAAPGKQPAVAAATGPQPAETLPAPDSPSSAVHRPSSAQEDSHA